MKDLHELFDRVAFAGDEVTWLVAAMAGLYGAAGLCLGPRTGSASRSGIAPGRFGETLRTILAFALVIAAAGATDLFGLVIVAGLQGQLLAQGAGAKRANAILLHRGADFLLGLALVELWRQGLPSDFAALAARAAEDSDARSWTLPGVCLALATVLRLGVPPFSEALAPLRRFDDPGRLVELAFGPGLTMLILCARTEAIFAASETASLVLTLLAVLAGVAGTQRALIASTRRALLQGLALAHTALALVLIAQGAPEAALAAMLILGMALAALWLIGELLRQEQGSDRLDRGGRAMRRRPWVGLVAAGVAGSLAGVPPTLGFTALDAVRWRAIAGGPGQGWLLWAAVLLIGAGAATAAARWWIASFLRGSVDQERRRDCDGQARIALAAGAILMLATPLAAPSWTGLPNLLGDLLAQGLGQERALASGLLAESSEGSFFRRGRSSTATGGAFGLIGAMATLAGIYLALRLETRDPEYLRRLVDRSGFDDEREGPRFLRRYLGSPSRALAQRLWRNSASSAPGAPVQVAEALQFLGQRLAGLQTGSFRLYAAFGLIAFLLLLLSLAR
jgi:Proton-conducting membrane transporter